MHQGHALTDCATLAPEKRCLAMGWLDYPKALDMVPHSWIVEILETAKVTDNVKSMLWYNVV